MLILLIVVCSLTVTLVIFALERRCMRPHR